MFEYKNDTIKSVLLLALAVSGNYVGNTLGCRTQYNMTNNMYVKHIVILCIIYFTLSYSTTEIPNPTELFKNTVLIWICFLLFTKQNIWFTILTSCLVIVSYVAHSYINYYKYEQDKYKAKYKDICKNMCEDMCEDKYDKKIQNLSLVVKCAYNLALVSLITGFFTYFFEKKNEYKHNFNYATFIFGKVTCNSLK